MSPKSLGQFLSLSLLGLRGSGTVLYRRMAVMLVCIVTSLSALNFYTVSSITGIVNKASSESVRAADDPVFHIMQMTPDIVDLNELVARNGEQKPLSKEGLGELKTKVAIMLGRTRMLSRGFSAEIQASQKNATDMISAAGIILVRMKATLSTLNIGQVADAESWSLIRQDLALLNGFRGAFRKLALELNTHRINSLSNNRADLVVGLGKLQATLYFQGAVLCICLMGLGATGLLLLMHRNKSLKLNVELRERNEEIIRASQHKEIFLSTMSHEIRTPLNGIIAGLDLLDDHGFTEKQINRLKLIRVCSYSLLELLNNILDLSKFNAGKMVFGSDVFDLSTMLGEVRDISAAKACLNSTLVSLHYDLPGQHYFGDGHALKQTVLNLTSNAVKFTIGGTVNIRARVLNRGSVENFIRIDVEDNGAGIPSSEQASLFKEFGRSNHANLQKVSGTGLGLFVSKKTIEAMGGTIGFTSTEGVGSVFYIELPLAAAEAPVRPQAVARQIAARKVLVADDHDISRSILVELLSGMGHEVFEAKDGQEAVTMARAHKYDIIMMDTQMPVMDGISAIKAIRKLGSEIPQPKIISVSANAFAKDRQAALEAGINVFLPKPISRVKLLEALSTFQDSDLLSEVGKENVQGMQSDGCELIDKAQVAAMAESLGPEVFLSFVRNFQTDALNLLSEIEEAFSAQDIQRQKQVMHTLKGAASTLGFMKVSDWAACMAVESLEQVDAIRSKLSQSVFLACEMFEPGRVSKYY